MFAHSPYIKCPYCGKDTFGIIIITDRGYSRRCQSCWRPKGFEKSHFYPLPKLNKKIIFLDQFVISNFMKLLNPRTKAHEKIVNDPFWQSFFEKISILTKGQFILCPKSSSHTNESLLSPYFKEHKRVYEMLSPTNSFKDINFLRRCQIAEHADCWIRGENYIFDSRADSAIYRRINVWQGHIYFSSPQHYLLDTKELKRKIKIDTAMVQMIIRRLLMSNLWME